MKALREMRDLAGITQFALSQRSGVSRMRLSLAECGEAELDGKELARVRTVLLGAIAARVRQLQAVLAAARSGAEQANS
jgi:transcriptional regulator with XRE-family HTH domain